MYVCMSKKKDAQHERCKFFIWDKMRTPAQETAPPKALRNCFNKAGGKVNIKDSGERGVECKQTLILQNVFC